MAVAITLKWQRALRATTFHQRAIKQPASHRIAPLTTRHHHKNLPHSPLARTPWNSLFGEKEGGRVSIMGFRGRAGGESGQIPPPPLSLSLSPRPWHGHSVLSVLFPSESIQSTPRLLSCFIYLRPTVYLDFLIFTLSHVKYALLIGCVPPTQAKNTQ